MNWTKVICYSCKKRFQRPVGQFNEARKFGWKQFCSKICQKNSKFTGKHLTCSNPSCEKVFYRELSDIRKVKQSFCSNSCAAKINNRLRTLKLPPNKCALPGCNVPIPKDQKYCSRLHGAMPRRIPHEIHKKQIIARIQTFYKTHRRIPVKREMYGIYRTTRSLFGSWNNAIRAAGLNPNPVMFALRHVAKDGHRCDSLAEKIIDDWLNKSNIRHERNIPYPGDQTLTADFLIGSHWIEFFGLAGVLKDYDKLMAKKRRLSKKYKLNLIEIYPKDLFPVSHLSEKLFK